MYSTHVKKSGKKSAIALLGYSIITCEMTLTAYCKANDEI